MSAPTNIFRLFVALVLSAVVGAVDAAPPATLDYQGFLTSSSGTPVDGTLNITFGLYDDAVSPASLWTTTLPVSVNHGVFSVQLGDPLIPFPVSWFENPMWLGIAVEGDAEMFPRRPLTAVGFAYLSQQATNDADTLGELNCAPDEVAKSGGGATWTCAQDNVGSSDWGNLTNVPVGFADDVDNDSGGDITAVNAGAGLTGGATSGDANLAVSFAGNGAVASAAHSDHNHDTVYYTQAQVNALLANLATQINAQQSQIVELQTKLQYLTVDGSENREIHISGANLHIESGSGMTDGVVNGLGNLIVGYNEPNSYGMTCSLGEYTSQEDCINNGGTWAFSHKSGSHNVVVGFGHNYSRYGGLAAGNYNTINGAYASSLGGGNIASGLSASVSGGLGNTASGFGAAVSGGSDNVASGEKSSVSGGEYNEATWYWSVVSAGYSNTSSGNHSSVSGGRNNFVGGSYSSISGGADNGVGGEGNSVSGGSNNGATGWYGSVTGGINNLSSGWHSSIVGGQNNEASGTASLVAGGGSTDPNYGNHAFSNLSAILGGKYNITGDPASENHAIGENATVAGGDTNTAKGHTSTASGGVANIATGYRSMVSGGEGNVASGSRSAVNGGSANSATADWSTVGGGSGDQAATTYGWCAAGLGTCAP